MRVSSGQRLVSNILTLDLSRALNKVSKLLIICTNKFLCYRGSEFNLYSFDQARPNGVVEICGER